MSQHPSSIPQPSASQKDTPVVVNVNTAKGGGLASVMVRSMVVSTLSSWFWQLIAYTGILPYLLALILWWHGWNPNPPRPPGQAPPPAAVDPRVDQIKPQVDDVELRLKKIEQDLQEHKISSEDIDRLRKEVADLEAEKGRLADDRRRAEEDGRDVRRRLAKVEAELSNERGLHQAHSIDLKWLQLAVLNAELKEEVETAGYHINSQCPHCGITMALKPPLKDDIGGCANCHNRFSRYMAWRLGTPDYWKWKREHMPEPNIRVKKVGKS